jgi:hypothetical protein
MKAASRSGSLSNTSQTELRHRVLSVARLSLGRKTLPRQNGIDSPRPKSALARSGVLADRPDFQIGPVIQLQDNPVCIIDVAMGRDLVETEIGHPSSLADGGAGCQPGGARRGAPVPKRSVWL